MIDILKKHPKTEIIPGSTYSYDDAVQYLASCKKYEYSPAAVARVAALHVALGSPLADIQAILVAGTNGKSTAIHCAAKLFREERVPAGAIYSSHVRLYTERFSAASLTPTNAQFGELVGEVADCATQNGIEATDQEVLFMVGALFCKRAGVEVVLIEVTDGGRYDISTIVTPCIAAITRVMPDASTNLSEDLDEAAQEMIGIAKPGTLVVSAEQSKIRLQKMKTWAELRGGVWVMPIRKLAPLPYIHEQLYGRTASLGERIVQMYVEEIKKQFSPFLRGNLLATKRGQRGRPTTEAKREAELNPIKTMKSFWNESFDLLPGRFELRREMSPRTILDCAHNADAFENVFLGLRLMHYKNVISHFALVIGLPVNIEVSLVMRSLRYLTKKVPGSVFFIECGEGQSHDPIALAEIAKGLHITAKSCKSLSDALREARGAIKDENGMLCVTGSTGLIGEFWKLQ